MIRTLQNTIKQDKECFAVPKSVQEAIPIHRLWPDGIFQFGTKYSKSIRLSDINYAIASKEDKTSMFLGYSELLNALDTGSTTKITINNKRINRRNFESTILLPTQGDFLDEGFHLRRVFENEPSVPGGNSRLFLRGNVRPAGKHENYPVRLFRILDSE